MDLDKHFISKEGRRPTSPLCSTKRTPGALTGFGGMDEQTVDERLPKVIYKYVKICIERQVEGTMSLMKEIHGNPPCKISTRRL